MPSATLCAPKCSLWCASSASAFGVSCALKLCFMERWTATADLSFRVRRIAKCAIAPFCHFLREVDSLHFPSESRALRALGRLRHPQLSGSSTRELNTWAGASAPPRALRGGPWTTLRVAHRLTRGFRAFGAPTSGASPWSKRPFPPIACRPSRLGSSSGVPPQSAEGTAGGGGAAPGGRGRRPRRSGGNRLSGGLFMRTRRMKFSSLKNQ